MDSVTYFVGAGLTKSLALCSKPIPAMRDFIYVAAEYLYDDVVLTTLADLELCDPYPYAWQSDQARELARKLTDGSRRTSQMRSDFARALRARPAESIEDVLDSTSETSSNFSSQTANLQFQYGINRLFGLVGWNLNWDPLRLFLAHQLRSHVAHNFVSFNYDIVFDHAIESYLGATFDLSSFYSFEPIGTIPYDPSGSPHASPLLTPVVVRREARPSISVLKPHGSLNWLRRTGSAPGSYAIFVPISDTGCLRYSLSTETHQWVRQPNELPFEVEQFISTPKQKVGQRSILEKEDAAIQAADEIYILGWSIPRTDRDQECLIRNAISKRSRPFQRVTIVDFQSDPRHFKRVAEIFGVLPRDLTVHNGGFHDFVSSLS